METTLVIYIGIYKTLGLVAAVVIGAWYLSGRLAKVETKVENFGTRITGLEGRMDSAFGSASPVALRTAGEKALTDSGLKKWIDDHKVELMTKCGGMENPYDIQSSAFKLFDTLDFGDFEPKLKEAAFQAGWSVQVMRRIGGIYFRDICLEHKGFKPEDLDTPQA